MAVARLMNNDDDYGGGWGTIPDVLGVREPDPAPPTPTPPPAWTPPAGITEGGVNPNSPDLSGAPRPVENKVYGGDLYGDLNKWNDPNHKTPKYVIGRIVEKYYNGRDNAGEAMAKALAEVQALFPGTTFDGKHRYNIPGVSSNIDMKSGKGRLQWYDNDAVAARPKVITPPGPGNKPGSGISPPGPGNLPPPRGIHPPGPGNLPTVYSHGGPNDPMADFLKRNSVGGSGGTGGTGTGGTGGTGGAGVGGGVGGGQTGPFDFGVGGLNLGLSGEPTIFDDPATVIMEKILRHRLDALLQPLKNPALDPYLEQAGGMMASLRAPRENAQFDEYLSSTADMQGELRTERENPQFDEYLRQAGLTGEALRAARSNPELQAYFASAADAQGQLRADRANPQAERYLSDADRRISELQGPVYSQQEEAALRVKSFDQMERDRANAKRMVTEQLAGMGHGEGSGTLVEALAQVDRSFDQVRGQRENALLLDSISRGDARKSEALRLGESTAGFVDEREDDRLERVLSALGIGRSAADARTSELDAALGRQTSALGIDKVAGEAVDSRADARLSRLGSAVNLGRSAADAVNAQQNEGIQREKEAFGINTDILNRVGSEQDRHDARQREAVTTASIFPELSERRLRLANETLGGGGKLDSLFQNIQQLLGNVQGNKGDTSAMWAELSRLIAAALGK